jgi:putative DNA primase/helicase
MEYLIQVALDGLKRVLKNNGFSVSDKVQEEIQKYNEKNNPVIGFVKDLELDVDIINQPTKDVYTRYKIYCDDNGLTQLAQNMFSEQLKKEFGVESKPVRVNGKLVRLYTRRE